MDKWQKPFFISTNTKMDHITIEWVHLEASTSINLHTVSIDSICPWRWLAHITLKCKNHDQIYNQTQILCVICIATLYAFMLTHKHTYIHVINLCTAVVWTDLGRPGQVASTTWMRNFLLLGRFNEHNPRIPRNLSAEERERRRFKVSRVGCSE